MVTWWLMALAMLLVVAGTLAVRSRVTVRDVAWLAGTAAVGGDETEVYRRYLTRHRRHRIVGGVLGALLAVIVGVRNYGAVQLIGAGEVSPFADVFFCAVAGIVVGALSAESYRLSEPRGPVQAASLAPRRPVGLPQVVLAARALAGAALVWGAGVLLATQDGAGFGVAVFGIALAVVAEATRAAVVGRRRPVHSPQAIRVDERIREFAGGSVSWLQLAAATVVGTWVVSLTPVDGRAWLGWLQVMVAIGGLLVTLMLLRRASPRPRRGWVVEAA